MLYLVSAILRDLVDAVLLRLVGDALVDLLRAHARDAAHLDKPAMDIGHAILRSPIWADSGTAGQ